jgi:hypothetical protein
VTSTLRLGAREGMQGTRGENKGRWIVRNSGWNSNAHPYRLAAWHCRARLLRRLLRLTSLRHVRCACAWRREYEATEEEEGRKHVLSRGGGGGVCVRRTRPPQQGISMAVIKLDPATWYTWICKQFPIARRARLGLHLGARAKRTRARERSSGKFCAFAAKRYFFRSVTGL